MSKKSNKKKEENGLLTESFLDKNGSKIQISDIITKEDCWFLKKSNAWILTHRAIKTIATQAGISKNFDVSESVNISPTYQNELEHIVRVTIRCNAKEKNTGCIHSDEKELTITGESNRVNTPHRGRGYLRKMAEKRAFDIAVLDHLNLYSSVFSEEEAKEYETKESREPSIMPGTAEFEQIVTEINAILNAIDQAFLKKVAKKIKKLISEKKYTDKQIKYLKDLYKQEFGKKNNDI